MNVHEQAIQMWYELSGNDQFILTASAALVAMLPGVYLILKFLTWPIRWLLQFKNPVVPEGCRIYIQRQSRPGQNSNPRSYRVALQRRVQGGNMVEFESRTVKKGPFFGLRMLMARRDLINKKNAVEKALKGRI